MDSLNIQLGATPQESINELQAIKDAMVFAILQKINTTGIQSADDPHYQTFEAIYLAADNQQHELASVHLLHRP